MRPRRRSAFDGHRSAVGRAVMRRSLSPLFGSCCGPDLGPPAPSPAGPSIPPGPCWIASLTCLSCCSSSSSTSADRRCRRFLGAEPRAAASRTVAWPSVSRSLHRERETSLLVLSCSCKRTQIDNIIIIINIIVIFFGLSTRPPGGRSPLRALEGGEGVGQGCQLCSRAPRVGRSSAAQASAVASPRRERQGLHHRAPPLPLRRGVDVAVLVVALVRLGNIPRIPSRVAVVLVVR